MGRRKLPQPPKPVEVSQGTLGEAYIQDKPPIKTFNRGNERSVREDSDKDISISLTDIDTAIKFYFDEVIKPSVIQNGNKLAVPILYGSPERWKSVQADGFYRDKEGKLMVPLIMFKRESIEKNRDLGTKLDGNEAHLFQIFEKKYTRKNIYDNFSLLTNRIPTKELYATMVPDYVTINYNCMIFTDYVEQMNPIIESINFASDSYWGNKNRFQFKSKIDNFTTQTEINQGEDRAVKTTFNIILNGYIIPNTLNKMMATPVSKFYSKSQIIFNFETTTQEIMRPTNNSRSAMGTTSVDAYNVNITTTTNIDSASFTYITTNKESVATSTTTTTATFPNGWLTAPSTMPATSSTNFTFFANGVYIERSAIVSFIDNGNNTSTLVIDTALLGYVLSGKEVIAIGKFA